MASCLKEPCPVFSLEGLVLHWNISSPACDGTDEEKKAKIRQFKRRVKKKYFKFIEFKDEHIKQDFLNLGIQIK